MFGGFLAALTVDNQGQNAAGKTATKTSAARREFEWGGGRTPPDLCSKLA